jgi:2-polyprenyl-3-methyl-5-hydroxy-6-metoxy-1,4-benzoquinol methylase
MDALRYYEIDEDTFWGYTKTWQDLEKKVWESSDNPSEFYQNWTGFTAKVNTCANIVNIPDKYTQDVVAHCCSANASTVIDYGCGTATLSLGLKINELLPGRLILLDVPNDIRKFVEYRIGKNKVKGTTWENVLEYNEKGCADLILCIDVLEHLDTPSETFIQRIAPLLRNGGHLILRAPWGGYEHITHLETAETEFISGGGKKYLNQNFRLKWRIGLSGIAGVYQKVSQ